MRIIKQQLITSCLAGLLCISSSVAEEEKSSAEEALDVFRKSDKELQIAYEQMRNDLVKEHTEAASLVKNFTLAHKAWLKWRDLEAEVIAYEESGGGHIHGESVSYAKVEMNTAKIKALLGLEQALPDEGIDYARAVGDKLTDMPSSIYQGWLDNNTKGVFVMQWLEDKKVRGFFYPEGKIAEYRFYGVNEKQGLISIQVYKGRKMIASGGLEKKTVKGKLQWSGNLFGGDQIYRTSMVKLDNDYPADEPEEKPYRVLAGFSRKVVKLSFHVNDRVSGHEDTEEGEGIFLSGINYRKGWMILEESGVYGDNEGLVGARMILSKRVVKDGIIWQGYKYSHDGDIEPVAFGRGKR